MYLRNNQLLKSLRTALICSLVLTSATAQQPTNTRTDLGAPGEEHSKLDQLAGAWNVTLKIPVAPGREIEGKASCEAKWVMDGRFLRQEYSSTFGGKPLTIVRYLGYDRHKGRYVEVHFESTHTDVMTSEGTMSSDGKSITCWGMLVDVGTDKSTKVRTITTFLDRDTFTLELSYVDSKPEKTITLLHKRK